MRSFRLPLVASIALTASIAFAATAAPALASATPALKGCNAAAAARVVEATNDYRTSLGLPSLTVVAKLRAFAAEHASDMADSAVLTHSSSDGMSFAERAHGSSYRFTSMRENVAVQGAPLPEALGSRLWSLWRSSPEHDANMRARDITQIGVAVAPGRNGCYASMELGSPR
jgi:uncharacterized protein YkwD